MQLPNGYHITPMICQECGRPVTAYIVFHADGDTIGNHVHDLYCRRCVESWPVIPAEIVGGTNRD
jgi:hypothetical protein